MSENRGILVRTERLTRHYEDGMVKALTDVSISIRHGEYLAIMGASGSGKSTLMNLLGGLDQPTSGEVYFEDQPLSSHPDLPQLRARRIGFVFQSFLLLPTLTAVENVQLPMFEGTLPRKQWAGRARDLLAAVHLDHRLHHLPAKLSVGERQRVAIARALANNPVLLLADEPTGNLDRKNARETLDLCGQLHRERGLTLVVVTHSSEVAERAKRCLELSDGQVIADRLTSAGASGSAAV